MKHFILCLYTLALLMPSAAFAQSDDTAGEVQRYDVEVAIFKNIKAPKSREFVLPVASPSRGDNIFDLASAGSDGKAKKLGYEIIPSSELRLLDVVGRLVESPRYELLLHVGWRQPGLDLEDAIPVWLRGGRIYGKEYTSIDNQIEIMDSIPYVADPGEETSFQFDAQTPEALEQQLQAQRASIAHRGLYELEGKITVSLSRYLHTYADLVFRSPRLTVDPETTNAAQAEYLAARAADTRILDNHLLKEHRRMRSRNLHYLDNPEFGMLILITPYEAPVTPPAEEAQ
ncbi:MAG: CsiV family protein [Gammaproteobacteria bacterium]|jgi:hypothetical protein